MATAHLYLPAALTAPVPGVLVAVGLAIFVAPVACPWPDGLDSVARTLGFESKAIPSPLTAPLADYRVPFFGSATVATAIAGAIGTAVAFVAAYFLSKVLVPVLGSRPCAGTASCEVLSSPKNNASGD